MLVAIIAVFAFLMGTSFGYCWGHDNGKYEGHCEGMDSQ